MLKVIAGKKRGNSTHENVASRKRGKPTYENEAGKKSENST